MSVWFWIGVALLGGIGACGRFALDTLISSRTAQELPLGTFAINISGALLLGLLTGLALEGDALLLAGSATLGSFTTFSTWMLETQALAEDGRSRAALLNVGLSLVLGVGAAALGRAIGAHL